MSKTKIEWADKVWNPVTGCTKVSEGCRNCYAEGIANSLDDIALPYEGVTQVVLREGGEWEDVFWHKYYEIEHVVGSRMPEQKGESDAV